MIKVITGQQSLLLDSSPSDYLTLQWIHGINKSRVLGMVTSIYKIDTLRFARELLARVPCWACIDPGLVGNPGHGRVVIVYSRK